jgi:hypothetical protein
VELALKEFLAGWRPSAKGDSEELVGASSLHVLFVQQIKQQVFVALDQPLRVDLTMLKLFISISLDAFEQGGKSLLLLLSQESFLLFYVLLKGVLSAISLV